MRTHFKMEHITAGQWLQGSDVGVAKRFQRELTTVRKAVSKNRTKVVGFVFPKKLFSEKIEKCY